jgi:predicted component of type VI protein secretion system
VAEDTFRVTVRAKSFADYQAFLPGHQRHKIMREMLDMLKPSQLDWEMQLELDEDIAAPARLDGEAPLGLASWMTPRSGAGVRVDARLRSG